MDSGMGDGEMDGSGGQGLAWWGIQDRGAGSSGGRGSNASGAAGGAGSEGKAHPKTGLNGARASQAKGDGLEDRP